ncbi:Membrane fusion protein Use1 [Moritella viscosa]|nr:Membrane fusion protein Use1 [Moritella viscosa]
MDENIISVTVVQARYEQITSQGQVLLWLILFGITVTFDIERS